ncbi:hypothetical protein ACJMK2_000551 [Sinanodonta woodiana]|uniref:Uncharacterized protein n=1 Tax=Sinanodonta woodiana TaxID=1069815 RepID=A0ABD3XSX4_SINWO
MTTSSHSTSVFESSVVDSDFIEGTLTNTSIAETKPQEGRTALKDCNIILFQESVLNGLTDGTTPSFNDLVCLADGKVVIVDNINSICCLYDSYFNLMSSCTMPTKPWNVCAIDTDEVAVTLPDNYKIQFLKIGDTIQPSGHITTRRMGMVIVALNKTELVYAGTMIDEKTYYWGTITRDGREKSCFHIPRGNITYQNVNIALNACKMLVYIACFDAETVFCFGLDGVQHFAYKVQEGPNPGKPMGIALDSEDNVYVVVRNMNSIHRLSPECQLQQIVKDMIPGNPRTICFKKSGDTFLVTSKNTKTANICYTYKLK